MIFLATMQSNCGIKALKFVKELFTLIFLMFRIIYIYLSWKYHFISTIIKIHFINNPVLPHTQSLHKQILNSIHLKYCFVKFYIHFSRKYDTYP